jgi:hypothetical protein
MTSTANFSEKLKTQLVGSDPCLKIKIYGVLDD